jgi:tRNA-intron endonuclease
MNDDKSGQPSGLELKTSGMLVDKGVRITEKSGVDALSSRGYGTVENEEFTLAFYEALYLLDKEMLEVKDENGDAVDFPSLLGRYEGVEENAWVNYLVYRDLRSRGYVAREGFGAGIDFRIYERGAYGKDTAPYLIMSIQEGTPVPIEDLANGMLRCQSLKKELILAVMNRRGEIVYYSVSQLKFK